jgi:hypothetical protein
MKTLTKSPTNSIASGESTEGQPLSIGGDELKQNGMTRERILHLLHEHLFESYGKEYRDEVIKRL